MIKGILYLDDDRFYRVKSDITQKEMARAILKIRLHSEGKKLHKRHRLQFLQEYCDVMSYVEGELVTVDDCIEVIAEAVITEPHIIKTDSEEVDSSYRLGCIYSLIELFKEDLS